MKSNNQKIHSLELVRAVAALSVMLGHADYIPVSQGIKNQITLWSWLPSFGVNLFFVLSGFVIYYVHGRHLGQQCETRNYLWRRFVRIWPLYALLTIIDAFIKPLILGGEFPAMSELAASLIFLELQTHPILGVGWTLNHEAFFYLIFAFALVFPKRLTIVCLVIFAALLTARAHDASYTNELTSWIFSPYRWHFISGIAAAAWFGNGLDLNSKRLSRKFSIISYISLITLLVCLGAFTSNQGVNYFTIANPLIISIAIIIVVTLESKFRYKIPNFLLYVAAASYSLYLTHSTILYVGIKMLNKRYHSLVQDNVDFMMLALCIISLVVGFLCHELIEKPLIQLFKKCARSF